MMAERSTNATTQKHILAIYRVVVISGVLLFITMMLGHDFIFTSNKLWSFQRDFSTIRVGNFYNFFSQKPADVPALSPQINPQETNEGELHIPQCKSNITAQAHETTTNNSTQSDLKWVSVELEPNYSSNLIAKWLLPGGEPCKDSKTINIKFVNMDDKNPNPFTTGDAHEIFFQAVDELGNVHCLGGDFFEIALFGESWRSRPPTKDLGNGTYSFTLQVHHDFAGNYTLTIILLFRHFQGLSFSPTRHVVDIELRKIPITFTGTKTQLPELQACEKSDFMRGIWAGRWTRHARNDACEVSNDGRYKCLDTNHPCTSPWCSGTIASLESNGWVYSAHCSFKLFSVGDSWNCLDKRWLFFWGDSNHVDTTRNIMFFFLGLPAPMLSRRFDMNVTNPRNPSQWVRITSIFNGHWDDKSNYLGLNSLINEGYRDLLKGYFSGNVVPDTIIFNSGLHDACFWHSIRQFKMGAEYAAKFWSEVIRGVQERGLHVPNFIFRSTIVAGGYARLLAFNPSKIEAYNGILLDRLKEQGLVTAVIDDFDMTWPWHYDNRNNDGVHYGRFPAKTKWKDGQIGHGYFVDLMLGHVLLNAICGR